MTDPAARERTPLKMTKLRGSDVWVVMRAEKIIAHIEIVGGEGLTIRFSHPLFVAHCASGIEVSVE